MSDKQPNIANIDRDCYVFQCPNCEEWTQVGLNEVNCGIFRHGYYFTNTNKGGIVPTEMMNPHTPKSVCEKLVNEKKICGCGKPFQFVKEGNSYVVKVCGYI